MLFRKFSENPVTKNKMFLLSLHSFLINIDDTEKICVGVRRELYENTCTRIISDIRLLFAVAIRLFLTCVI